MDKEKKVNSISRRRFLKNFGTGLVGSSVVIHGLRAAPSQKDEKQEPQISEKAVPLSLKVNGKNIRAMVEPNLSLADLLRNELRLTGTKIVCNHGECGACTVLLDGKAVYSCHMLALDAEGKEVVTVEGLMTGEELHPLQKAFVDKDGFQCGFCTPGQVMAAQALLMKNAHPTRDQILEGMSGNLCRCSAYPKIADSVVAAAKK